MEAEELLRTFRGMSALGRATLAVQASLFEHEIEAMLERNVLSVLRKRDQMAEMAGEAWAEFAALQRGDAC